MRDVYGARAAVERGGAPDGEFGDGAAGVGRADVAGRTWSGGDATAGRDEAGTGGAVEEGVAPAGPVTRRAALKVLGVLPAVAGTLGAQPPAGQPKVPHTMPNQPATGPAVQPPNNRTPARFFTAREARTAGVLADDIIPKDERSGSATEAGVLPFIEFNLTVPEATPEQRTAMRGGLRWVDTESRRRFGVAYDRATEAQRHAILDDVSKAPADVEPRLRAGAAFFSQFRSMVGAGFFSSAIGHRDLRYQGNVFNPNWNGCPQPALDKLGVSYALMDTRVRSQATGG